MELQTPDISFTTHFTTTRKLNGSDVRREGGANPITDVSILFGMSFPPRPTMQGCSHWGQISSCHALDPAHVYYSTKKNQSQPLTCGPRTPMIRCLPRYSRASLKGGCKMILKCNCAHKAQDRLHGDQLRVHNERMSKGHPLQPPIFRCTVCKTERGK